MGIRIIFKVLLLSVLIPNYTNAQSDTIEPEKVLVVMANGIERVGVILSDDGREILLETEALGQIYIAKADIVSITVIDDDVVEPFDGDVRLAGPFTTRYYFTTSALPIKKGEDYAMINLYGPEAHFSLSKNFSLGVMSTWIASPFIAVAKYTIPTGNENINLGIGGMFGTTGYINSF